LNCGLVDWPKEPIEALGYLLVKLLRGSVKGSDGVLPQTDS